MNIAIDFSRCGFCLKQIAPPRTGRPKRYCSANCQVGASRERSRLVPSGTPSAPEAPRELTESEAYEIPTSYSIRLNEHWTVTDLMNGEYGLRKGGWVWGYCHTKAEMLDVVAAECGPVRASVMEAVHRWPDRG